MANNLQQFNDYVKSSNKNSFNREIAYNFFFNHIKYEIDYNILREYDSDTLLNKVDLLLETKKEYQRMISLLEWNNKEYDRYILELQTDVCTRFIENLLNKLNNDELNNIFNNTNENFNYYPDLSDTQFNQKIFYKKEFNDNKMPLLKDKKKKKFRTFQ